MRLHAIGFGASRPGPLQTRPAARGLDHVTLI